MYIMRHLSALPSKNTNSKMRVAFSVDLFAELIVIKEKRRRVTYISKGLRFLKDEGVEGVHILLGDLKSNYENL